jgi:hypothetical protein
MKVRQLLSSWRGGWAGDARRGQFAVAARWRWILRRFVVAQISFHSLSTAPNPRRLNWR